MRTKEVTDNPLIPRCWQCKKTFTNENVYSLAGWKETKISGLCELCFDKACSEEQEDPSTENLK